MSHHETGILTREVIQCPMAVVDVETTGLKAGPDRIVEISIVRHEPGRKPFLALNTLVNPDRPMAATDIHGITDDDVRTAPRFEHIADDVVNALSGCIVSAYNAYFDMRFIDYEMQRAGRKAGVPYLCLMYMRPFLGLGPRCSLHDACVSHGIDHTNAHTACADAMAGAMLWQAYGPTIRQNGIRTFGDLSDQCSYKFTSSFSHAPLPSAGRRAAHVELKPRGQAAAPVEVLHIQREPEQIPLNVARGRYWDALLSVVEDLVITDQEQAYLEKTKQELRLQTEQIRSLHARLFSQVIDRFIDDKWLDDRERLKLHKLHQCLSKLGWAPGE